MPDVGSIKPPKGQRGRNRRVTLFPKDHSAFGTEFKAGMFRACGSIKPEEVMITPPWNLSGFRDLSRSLKSWEDELEAKAKGVKQTTGETTPPALETDSDASLSATSTAQSPSSGVISAPERSP
jgi:hypothetical protein